MKNLKRIFTMGLVLTMLATLAACSPETIKETSEATDTSSETTDPSTETANEEATDVDATDGISAEDATTSENTEVDKPVVVRRTIGDIVMPQTVTEIPQVFEEVTKLFPLDVTDEVKSEALVLFTLAVTAELENDNDTAVLAWEEFDALNLIS